MARKKTSNRRANQRRRLSLEALEDRRVMAAYISELAVDTRFSSSLTQQYAEIRGEPNAPIENTYLVTVEARSFLNSEGRIASIIDLSGLQFGENGYLTIIPETFQRIPSEQSTVLQRNQLNPTLPDPRFLSTSNLGALILPRGDYSYLLIQSPTVPQLNDDIDENSDAFIDTVGAPADWTVLDSVSIIQSNSTGRYAYGRIAFIEDSGFTTVVIQPTATQVRERNFTYVARVGESTGSTAADWVGGVVEEFGGGLRFDFDLFDQASIPAFNGRQIESLGEPNFPAAIRGTAFFDENSDGMRDETETVLPGVSVLADSNGNGVQDVLFTTVDPEDYNAGFDLTNAIPGVTFTEAYTPLNGEADSRVNVRSAQLNEGAGRRAFSSERLPFFTDTFPLRMDFYRPARAVTVDFVARFSSDFGVVEAFDKSGASLGIQQTPTLVPGQRGSITLSFASDDIAYATAYMDVFGAIDRVQFAQSEVSTVTDASGNYLLNYLDPADYRLVVSQDGLFQTAPDISELTQNIVKYENKKVDFGFGPNVPPILESQKFTTAEHPRAGRLIGKINVIDPNVGQPFHFTLNSISGSAITAFNPGIEVDSRTGEIRSRNPDALDFESGSEIILNVSVTDEPDALPVSADFTITLTDINEPPVFLPRSFPLAEVNSSTETIGTLSAVDADVGEAGKVRFDILAGNDLGIFGLDSLTGELTLLKPGALDFEKTAGYTLTVAATDHASLPQRTIVPIVIDLSNTNEEPRFDESADIVVSEDAPGESILGVVSAFDPDSGQTVFIEAIGGDDSTAFGIISVDPETGRLSLAPGAKLNFEAMPELTLKLKISDSNIPPLSIERSIKFVVEDVNEPPELALAQQTVAVDELSFLESDRVLTTFSVSDPEKDEIIAEIVGGNGSEFVNVIAPDAATGTDGEFKIVLKDGVILDFETLPVWNVVLMVTEKATAAKPASETLSTTSVITVRVRNQNEPPVIESKNLAAQETASAGSAVARIVFADPDVGQRVNLSLVSDDSGLLVVDQATGVINLKPNAVFNRAAKPEINLVVKAEDNLGAAVDVPIKLTVIAVNNPPTPGKSIPPLEAPAKGTFSYQIPENVFSDPENGQITLSLDGRGTTLPSWLKFDSTTRTIFGTVLPRDAGTYRLLLVATDNGSPAATGILPIDLTLTPVILPGHNTTNPPDVDNSGKVEPVDALFIINLLNTNSSGPVIDLADYPPLSYFPDVDQDNLVTPIDALLVINKVNEIALASQLQSEPLTPSKVDAAFAGFGTTDDDDDNDQADVNEFGSLQLF